MIDIRAWSLHLFMRAAMSVATAALGFALAVPAADAATSSAQSVYKRGDYEFEVAPVPSWVKQHEIAANWDAGAPGSSGARWRNWLVDAQVDRRSHRRERFFDVAYEPVSSELVRDAGKHEVWFSPDHQRLILHHVLIRRDGVWQDRLVPASITLARRESEFERDMANGMVSALIVLSDIRVGDVVRISYTIVGDNPVLGGLVDEEFGFGAMDPILDRNARVLFDAGTKLAEHSDRGSPRTTTRSARESLEWSAEEHAVPAILDEGSYPIWYNVAPRIVVGTRRSWADVAVWARALYPVAQALPADLEQRISEWRALPDPEQRIAAALRSAQEDVRYFGTELGESTHKPSEPAETWTRRYGDCKDKARLLATVLGRLDIEAYPTLVSARRGKSIADLPPAASLFDHVIVEVRLKNTTLWLDATQTQQRGLVRSHSAGDFGFALPVASDTRDLVKVEVSKDAIDHLRVSESMRPSATQSSISLDIESDYEGAAADRTRRRLNSEGKEVFERSFLDFYRKRYGDVVATSPIAIDDNEQRNTLHISEHYLLKKPWIKGAPGEQAIEVYAEALEGELVLPKTSERQAPLAVAYPLEIEQSIQIELPAGWRWLSSPSNRTLEDSAMTFEFRLQQTARGISMNEHLSTRQEAVSPDNYPKHFSMLRDANEFLSRRLLIGTSPTDATRERDDRLHNLMRGILDDAPKAPKGGGE